MVDGERPVAELVAQASEEPVRSLVEVLRECEQLGSIAGREQGCLADLGRSPELLGLGELLRGRDRVALPHLDGRGAVVQTEQNQRHTPPPTSLPPR